MWFLESSLVKLQRCLKPNSSFVYNYKTKTISVSFFTRKRIFFNDTKIFSKKMKWKNLMILDKIALRPLNTCAFLFFCLFSNALLAFLVLFVVGFFNGFSRNFYYFFEKMSWFFNVKGNLAKSHWYKPIALETSVNYYFKTCPCYIGINFFCTTVMTSTKVKRKSSWFLSGHFLKNEKKQLLLIQLKK